VTRAIETAQKRVESYNFDIRKHLLEYDNVMNRQREIIYEERRMVLESDDLREHIFGIIENVLDKKMEVYLHPSLDPSEWDTKGLSHWLKSHLFVSADEILKDPKERESIAEHILDGIEKAYETKRMSFGAEMMHHMEKMIILQVIDSHWKDHLYGMDRLREGIGLRAYGQRDPLVEYQHEGFDMFFAMIERIKEETVEFLFKVRAVREERKSVFEAVPQSFVHEEMSALDRMPPPANQQPEQPPQIPPPRGVPPTDDAATPYTRETPKVGRNDPCPCGSGKKYKKCCGK
jgi:preprotein translocase subunit SecA